MMSTMLCALGQAFEEATHRLKVKPLVTTSSSLATTEIDGKTDLQANKSVEIVDIEEANDLKVYQANARKVSVGLVSL